MTAAATAAPSEWVIDLEHVSKTYAGGVQALRGIEMKVRRGEIFGLLGPNGAGKSTLVKILLTIIRPTQAAAPSWAIPSVTSPPSPASATSPSITASPATSPAPRSSTSTARCRACPAPTAAAVPPNYSTWSA
jgi:energy-coupling factor transporter ATP-binding protein EcfA2